MFDATPTEFTPLASFLGGVLIGLSATLVMVFLGRITGITGIAVGGLSISGLTADGWAKDWSWRLAFVAGLIAAPLAYQVVTGTAVTQTVSDNLPLMAIAGLLVGVGTTVGGGCTSGHGVCGLSRLSLRSLAAVITFMAFGAITVFVTRHIIGA
jgi:uncharacterized membrane protein YedE/YeeE